MLAALPLAVGIEVWACTVAPLEEIKGTRSSIQVIQEENQNPLQAMHLSLRWRHTVPKWTTDGHTIKQTSYSPKVQT